MVVVTVGHYIIVVTWSSLCLAGYPSTILAIFCGNKVFGDVVFGYLDDFYTYLGDCFSFMLVDLDMVAL